jgi:alkaline phosphatase D
MRTLYLLTLLLSLGSAIAQQDGGFKIAFGSCSHQDHPLPIFNVITDHEPDLFIFLGDNIYGDTENMDTLAAKYNKLDNKPSFQSLKNSTEIIATWDDHDYGWNDAGKHYPYQEESKALFLDFFEEPKDSERRVHDGIYHSYYYEHEGKTIQVILLDVRTFRDNLKPYNGEVKNDRRYFYDLYYASHGYESDATILGIAQWNWLRDELKKPADLRIIGTGSQFGIEYNGYEAWANFPAEQLKMLNVIKQTNAENVMFISGDVHYAEISKMNVSSVYPIYDITSSGLSSSWHYATPNCFRIEGPVMENHFGLLTVNFEAEEPHVKAEIWDVYNNQRIEYTILLSELTFSP